MYRSEILNRDFSNVNEYLSAWGEFQNKFISETDSYKRYEVWCSFSGEKIKDGWSKIERKVDMKKGLKEKQLEVELDKYKTMLELKETDNSEQVKLQKENEQLRNQLQQNSKKEQDLREEVIAWRELLDSKDEDLDILKEKYNHLKRQRDEMGAASANPRQNINRKDHIIVEETGKSATCSSNDCVIF